MEGVWGVEVRPKWGVANTFTGHLAPKHVVLKYVVGKHVAVKKAVKAKVAGEWAVRSNVVRKIGVA